MKKQKIKDIATTLIYSCGVRLDMFAFDECDISDEDRDAILDEVNDQYDKIISKMENRYSTEILTHSTSNIVSKIANSK